MPTVAELEAIVRASDRSLSASETVSTNAIDREIRVALLEIEAEIRQMTRFGVDPMRIDNISQREALARVLVGRLQESIAAFNLGAAGSPVPDQIGRSLIVAQRSGADLALRVMAEYDATLDKRARANIDAIQAALGNARDQLTKNHAAFAVQLESALVAGLVRGDSAAKLIETARELAGALESKAEGLLTTETGIVRDNSARDTYTENGLDYIQWAATLDDVVCGFCADRHMQIFKKDEAPIPAHIRCRCVPLGFKLDWLKDGLISAKDIEDARDDAIARSDENPKSGATPAEKYAGREAAKPVKVAA